MQFFKEVLRKIKPDEEVTLAPSFSKKSILIVGAQTVAGKEIALDLAHDGHRIGLAYESSPEILTAISKEIIDQGAEVNLFEFTAGDANSVSDVVTGVVNQYHGLDILVICLEETSQKQVDDIDDLPNTMSTIMNVNYYAAVHFAFYSAPYLRKTRGKIIHLTSMDAGDSEETPGALFHAARAATLTFFETLQEEEAGLQVIIVHGNNGHPYEITKTGSHALAQKNEVDVSGPVQNIVVAIK